MTVKDEKTRWCVAIEVARAFAHEQIIEVLTRLLARYGCPQYIRSDNGPELVATTLLKFFDEQGIKPSRILPEHPWQNGSNENFNRTFRRECLDAERFHSLTEAQVVIEDWQQRYNQVRPHRALGYQTLPTLYWGSTFPQRTTEKRSNSQGKISTSINGRQAGLEEKDPPNNHPENLTYIETKVRGQVTRFNSIPPPRPSGLKFGSFDWLRRPF